MQKGIIFIIIIIIIIIIIFIIIIAEVGLIQKSLFVGSKGCKLNSKLPPLIFTTCKTCKNILSYYI